MHIINHRYDPVIRWVGYCKSEPYGDSYDFEPLFADPDLILDENGKLVIRNWMSKRQAVYYTLREFREEHDPQYWTGWKFSYRMSETGNLIISRTKKKLRGMPRPVTFTFKFVQEGIAADTPCTL